MVLWSEVWRLLKGLFSRRFNAEQAYVLKLVLSMIPIGVIGFLFKDRINAMLDAPYILVIVGAMLLLTATLLAFAYYAKPRQKETISYRDALIIGLAQACAAMPGPVSYTHLLLIRRRASPRAMPWRPNAPP